MLFVQACGTRPLNYESATYPVTEQKMKFSLLIHSVKSAKKVALIVPHPFDKFDYQKNPITRFLIREGYSIVISPTVKEIPNLDKRKWTYGLADAFYRARQDSLIPAHPDDFILIGFEEGGYILTDLAGQLKPDLFIAINSGPHSPMQEMLLALQDTSTDAEPFVKAYDAIDSTELALKTHTFQNDRYKPVLLGERSGEYWLSFYEDPAYQKMLYSTYPGYYILFKQYPLINTSSVELLERVLPKEPSRKVELISLPGKGEWKNEEDLDQLTKQLKSIVNNPR
jgi:hypothetical protein